MKRRSAVLSVIAAFTLALSACQGGDGGGAGGGDDTTLKLAFFADVVTVDPDVFYDIEGAALTQSVYSGLLRYGSDSTELEGDLATEWTVDESGTTYTFTLREATFSDGTPLDSAAVQQSFERRVTVAQGPSYMLAEVESYETPDASTFVVNLQRPVADFLDRLASMWGPKVINPQILDEYSDDQAQDYLTKNSAGSGPYELTRFEAGQGYTLERNPNYWGDEPYFETVEIGVQPNVSSQQLQVRRGDLDAVLHGVPISSLDSAEQDADTDVAVFDSLGTVTLAINQESEALGDAETRRSLIAALDVPSLVDSTFGSTATAMTSPYPAALLDAGTPAAGSVDEASLDGLTVRVVYTPDSSGVQARLADVMRQRLASVGVTVKAQRVQLAEVYGYRDNPADAPEIYLSTPTPDAASADSWARILWYTEGPLNFFSYSNPLVDEAIDAGQTESDQATSEAAYAKAGELAAADAVEVPIAQLSDIMLLSPSLTGVVHSPAYPWTLDLAALERK